MIKARSGTYSKHNIHKPNTVHPLDIETHQGEYQYREEIILMRKVWNMNEQCTKIQEANNDTVAKKMVRR